MGVANGKILVVGPSWVGDMIMAQSLFMTIKQHRPQARIDVLAPGWTRPLLERMPEVTDSIAMPVGHGKLDLKSRYRLGRQLRECGYDQAILLPNSLKSALIPWFARIPRRSGFLGEMRWGLLNDVRPLDKSRLSMTVQRFVALGLSDDAALPAPIPQPKLQVDPQCVDSALGRLQMEKPQAPILALCPGAEYGPAKRWPSDYFAQIARDKLKQGWVVWVFGSEKDKPVADAICDAAGTECINLAGCTRLDEAIDLMSLAELVISNDSGLMHLAAALDKKLVALYGSSDIGFTPPLCDHAEVLSLNLDCSPCFKRECPLGHMRCLNDLTPTIVRDAINRLDSGPLAH
ncbi:MAG: lipopolysaccharide heptosyltransferase II [Gammaproteobacteria bacterium]|nr:lipopolysaccharide heptosyltransferase II [Gammaproteobacteria bacterium]